MSWKTKTLRLTADQKSRGVIYSSQLIVLNAETNNTLHEVYDDGPNKWQKIENLKDVKFFKNFARDLGWDAINEVRR
jgi:hypothetical protein